jgi:UDP-glucose 4-epimerase
VTQHTPHPRSDADPSAPGRRVLVTGGAGFIGSHLTDLLLARGDRVTVVDNLSTGRRSNLPASREGLRFIEAELSDALDAFDGREGFDEIYHLAAAVGVRLVMSEPIRSIETNVEQTAALLRFAGSGARGPSGRPPVTLIASSSEVYGKSSKSPFREDDDVVYGPTTVGRWSYACSKAIDEYLALAHHAQHGVPVVVCRFFNTVGPKQVGDYGMVLPRFVEAAIAGSDLPVYGDGSASRCFCDVRDVVSVLPRLLANPTCRGRIFNVGSDRPITIASLARLVIKTLGSASGTRRLPYAEAFGPGFEDPQQRQPDLSSVRGAVGFEPRFTLEQTIRDLAESMTPRSAAC